MSKNFLFFITLLCLITINSNAISEILPIKKPVESNELTQKKLLIDVLKPLPKPIKNIETKQIKKQIIVKKEKKIGIILPKKNH